MITSLGVARPPMRGILTPNERSRGGSDAWCTHLSVNPMGYLPMHSNGSGFEPVAAIPVSPNRAGPVAVNHVIGVRVPAPEP